LIITATLFGFLRPEPPKKISSRTLTFAERVDYQRAIEEIYWRHRIWTGSEMIVWGGNGPTGPSATPTPTPTPTLTPRSTPLPRVRPTPHPRF